MGYGLVIAKISFLVTSLFDIGKFMPKKNA